jgi:hypothetical protein
VAADGQFGEHDRLPSTGHESRVGRWAAGPSRAIDEYGTNSGAAGQYGHRVTTWVLEQAVFPDFDDALAGAVLDHGGQVVAWNDDWWFDGRWPRLATEAVVFHGSLANAARVLRELPWTPGGFCSTARFRCSAWWPELAHRLVSESFVVTTVMDLVLKGPPPEFGDQVFVRPDSPLKPFSGRVLGRGSITLAALDHGFYYDEIDLPVVIAPAVRVGVEWRFVVASGAVVAGSGYSADGRAAGEAITPAHAVWRYAVDVAADVKPPDPVYVMDICETDRGLRLLELNPFSGADLYSCDRGAVVEAVNALVG